MMALPVSGSWPTVYRPSQRPSFRFRMFPSLFARLFGIKSAPFATNNTVTKGTKLLKRGIVIRKLSFEFGGTSLPYLCLWRRNFCVAGDVLFSYSGAILDGQEALSIDYSGAKYTRFIPKIAAMQKSLF